MGKQNRELIINDAPIYKIKFKLLVYYQTKQIIIYQNKFINF